MTTLPPKSNQSRRAGDREEPELVRHVREFPSLSGDRMLRSTIFEKGIVRLTEGFFSPDKVGESPTLEPTSYALRWQGMHEAYDDHGYSTACGVLFDAGLWRFDRARWDTLVAQSKLRTSPAIWQLVEAAIDPTPMDEDGAIADALLVAVWAELFTEPLSDIWLAAMAMHAREIEGNDFAFGYFTAQLDHRKAAEADYVRGRKSVDSGKRGGAARKFAAAPRTLHILSEMQKLVDRGHSARRAAELVAKKGIGASTEANKKLWARHSKKVET